MRRRLQRFLIVVSALLLFVGCAEKEHKESKEKVYGDVCVQQVLSELMDSQESFADGSFDWITEESEHYQELLEQNYGLTLLNGETCAFAVTSGKLADEVCVYRTKTRQAEVEKKLKERLEKRTAMFYGYEPVEYEKLTKSKVYVRGEYVILLVVDDLDKAVDRMEYVLSKEYVGPSSTPTSPTVEVDPTIEVKPTEPKPTAPTEELSDNERDYLGECGYYYNKAIITAYQTGDTTALTSSMDLALYHKCAQILSEILHNNMTLVEKEFAIHDYVAIYVDYDYDHYSVWGEKINSDNAYGALMKGEGICSGFASAFELLCRMAGIECIIVDGTAYDEREAHAWNKVNFDGIWYNVDTCWDDCEEYNVSSDYLNVTDAYMTETEHYWEESKYPASDTEFDYSNMSSQMP